MLFIRQLYVLLAAFSIRTHLASAAKDSICWALEQANSFAAFTEITQAKIDQGEKCALERGPSTGDCQPGRNKLNPPSWYLASMGHQPNPHKSQWPICRFLSHKVPA